MKEINENTRVLFLGSFFIILSILGGISVYFLAQFQQKNIPQVTEPVLGVDVSKNVNYETKVNLERCTSFIYSEWNKCENGTQVRQLLSKMPLECTIGTPELERLCDSTPVVCGMIDSDNNGRVDINDSNEFTKVFNKTCSDFALDIGCGRKDVNGDGQISDLDLINFSKKFGNQNCQ